MEIESGSHIQSLIVSRKRQAISLLFVLEELEVYFTLVLFLNGKLPEIR